MGFNSGFKGLKTIGYTQTSQWNPNYILTRSFQLRCNVFLPALRSRNLSNLFRFSGQTFARMSEKSIKDTRLYDHPVLEYQMSPTNVTESFLVICR